MTVGDVSMPQMHVVQGVKLVQLKHIYVIRTDEIWLFLNLQKGQMLRAYLPKMLLCCASAYL